jgi:hypothetical protein
MDSDTLRGTYICILEAFPMSLLLAPLRVPLLGLFLYVCMYVCILEGCVMLLSVMWSIYLWPISR